MAAELALICGAAIVTLSMGIRHGFGLWLQPITMDRGWTRETFALAIAVQNLSWGVAGPFAGALADRFGLYDRFFVNAEVSADGHNWSTAAYATDYLEKTVQSNYSSRGRTYDYEGTNRGNGMSHVPDDDVNAPAAGYLWDLAVKKGVTLRNYGEFVQPEARDPDDKDKDDEPKYRGVNW